MGRDSTNNQQEVADDFYSPDKEQIALLRSILQKESHQPVSLIDAQEVGVQLIALYECLARDRIFLTRMRGVDES